MSKFPVDIVNFDEEFEHDLDTAINISNSIQSDFIFNKVDRNTAQKFKLIHLDENDGNEFLTNAIEIKHALAGYYPYMLFISAKSLIG